MRSLARRRFDRADKADKPRTSRTSDENLGFVTTRILVRPSEPTPLDLGRADTLRSGARRRDAARTHRRQ